ncbi:MAG: alpha/beta hydrolase [Gammaproteobacteria bacterium]|nr:alpha/beta hydrolase [Gammaproteobacteria bacterium]
MSTSQAHYEPIVGRYLNLELLGRAHRLYVEEAGQGIPLLCLHTAGADTRQWRGLMNDPEVTRDYRVIAFDMPWHGKSSPPPGWQTEEYRLTMSDYSSMTLTVADALELDKPVVMGCSIGGRIALVFAIEQPERFGAIIGLQSGATVDPYYELTWLHHPTVHGGESSAAYVSGLMAPSSPDLERWETLWHYMQSGPGIFKGDLYFYRGADGDIRARLAEIDTSCCPLYLLTGEYDYSVSPQDTQSAAECIAGVKFWVMPKLGHFPMSENPALFLSYLKPVLAEIRENR